jgi:hypothetical protein
MLARYQIVRGRRDPHDPLPEGKRIDTRKHTRHFLRPESQQVARLLSDLNTQTYAKFAKAYNALLIARFAEDRAPFDALAALSAETDVYLGCSCPSSANPDVQRCHTVLALRFMKKKYPKLEVRLPT